MSLLEVQHVRDGWREPPRALDKADEFELLRRGVFHVSPSKAEAVTLFLSSRFCRTSSTTTCFSLVSSR